MSTIVVMPGGFHPFHAGHAALYNSARRVFPDAEVFVAATNDTSTRPFPFQIKEKLAKLAGVEPGHFVQVKSPFQAKEITANFNPDQDTLIFVRSEKDSDKPPQAGGVKKDGNPAYLQPLLGANKLEPFGKHAYMAYLPTVEFGPGMTSATEIRTAWPKLNDRRKTALVMSLYPRTQNNPALAGNVVNMLDTAMGVESLEEDSLNEFASDDFDDRPKFIPWHDFIEGVKGIVGKEFEVVENVVKSTIKARFVPFDAMEYGPTMLYSYYEARAGRNKGAVSTRGSIQVGHYYPNSTQLGTRNYITGFNILKGHPFERHFDLTPENISKIASIILGNTEGAYKVQPQGVAEETRAAGGSGGAGMSATWQKKYNQPPMEGQGFAATLEENPDYIEEKWSEKYKRSIDCSNPKGFSQRAHCAGRKK